MTLPSRSADEWIAHLSLVPHPEGGFFRELHRDRPSGGVRGSLTSIYFLLRRGEVSAWHRVTDAVEIWYFHAGAPLELTLYAEGTGAAPEALRLGLASPALPQAVVPAGVWQTARSEGDWTLVGCSVAPAFEFSSFEMAPPGWTPGGR
jgi:predicted cupin superfamily sugar epimerase